MPGQEPQVVLQGATVELHGLGEVQDEFLGVPGLKPAQADGALPRRIEPREDPEQGALSASGWRLDPAAGTGLDGQVEVPEDPGALGGVAEGDIVQDQGPR